MVSHQYGSSQAMANNSIVVASSCSSYVRFDFYCCTNRSSVSGAELIGRDNYNVMYSYRRDIMQAYSFYSDCVRFRSYDYYGYGCSYYFTSSYQGVYTCKMADSNGIYQDFSMGIYPNGFSCKCLSDSPCLLTRNVGNSALLYC